MKQRLKKFAPPAIPTKEKSLSKVSASLPRGYYSFDAKEIEGLMEDYGLNLTLIESRETILLDKNSKLVVLLEKQQASNLSEKLGINNIDSNLRLNMSKHIQLYNLFFSEL